MQAQDLDSILEENGLHLKGELPMAELDLGIQDELIQLNKPLRN